jgi:hypothetical protein
MSLEKTRHFIASLPIDDSAPHPKFAAKGPVDAVEIDNLPDGLVTGSNLLQFEGDLSPQLRSSVALSLLAAQRVAANDPITQTPDQWVARHNTVLQNLNWSIQGGGHIKSKFDNIDIAVHQAIIPFLATAFTGGAGGGSLIIAALDQMKKIDADKPWITLFNRESRRFEVTEYQFSVVKKEGLNTTLQMACARFDATFGQTQVLFVDVTAQKAEFMAAKSSMAADSSLLAAMNEDLKLKLAAQTKSFIASLPL